MLFLLIIYPQTRCVRKAKHPQSLGDFGYYYFNFEHYFFYYYYVSSSLARPSLFDNTLHGFIDRFDHPKFTKTQTQTLIAVYIYMYYIYEYVRVRTQKPSSPCVHSVTRQRNKCSSVIYLVCCVLEPHKRMIMKKLTRAAINFSGFGFFVFGKRTTNDCMWLNNRRREPAFRVCTAHADTTSVTPLYGDRRAVFAYAYGRYDRIGVCVCVCAGLSFGRLARGRDDEYVGAVCRFAFGPVGPLCCSPA